MLLLYYATVWYNEPMFAQFAHAGHVHTQTMEHDMNYMTLGESVDHCMPIIICASIIIVVLLCVIAYLLMNWQPKPVKKTPPTKKSD